MKVYTGRYFPIKSWCHSVDEGTLDQALHLSSLPFLFKSVCLMADTHKGYGMPIGGVIGTKGVVIPNAVGVDIGCGMCAVKTSLKTSDMPVSTIKNVLDEIRKVIPVGFSRHTKPQDESLMPVFKLDKDKYGDFQTDLETHLQKAIVESYPVVSREYESALTQLGTLGGGNHFIEIQKDKSDYIWIMLHSGSRNLGKQVADYYNKIAVDLNAKWFSGVEPAWELAFLPIDSIEGRSYLLEMQYCVEFALASRKLMMDRAIGALFECVGKECSIEQEINIAHNYARMENHFGQNIMVHRKGATSAKGGELGIIPGSQGTSSYIVIGKGNLESFQSCSHGAGRLMSRSKARETLSLEEEQRKLDDMGVVHAINTKKDLDEASSAYKDIDVVMEEQKDLVDIYVKLIPLGVIKG